MYLGFIQPNQRNIFPTYPSLLQFIEPYGCGSIEESGNCVDNAVLERHVFSNLGDVQGLKITCASKESKGRMRESKGRMRKSKSSRIEIKHGD